MNKQTAHNAKITALYSRLSRDDDLVGESGSIQMQKSMLEDYAAKNGFSNVVHYVDDGFSGGNFDRPSWKNLISEIEKGHVATVISKDMSRVGRDYLQTGFYTEVFFREKGVRFIAVANNIDSHNQSSSEFAPFLNIMSEWYIRDSSRKVKASHKARGMSGKRLTFRPIYGYALDPNDRNKWIVDPESAEVIRRMFQLTIEGKGPFEIARIFTSEKIDRPTIYMYKRGIVNYESRCNSALSYAWNGNTVVNLLSKPEYMGHTVNFRSTRESYKDKRSKENPKEEWVIFENTHPGIVDSETWETAQRCRKTIRRTDSHGEANPLTGLVFCADCGAKLYNHRQPHPIRYATKKGQKFTRGPNDMYACATYNNSGKRFDRKCTMHYIRTAVLWEIALIVIRAASSFVQNNEAEFIQQVHESSAIRHEETAKSHKKKITKAQKRIAELNHLIKRIYEDNIAGKIIDKRFELLSQEYEQEQSESEQAIIQLQAELDRFTDDGNRAERFIEIVKRYTDFSELSPSMITEFIEKIVVHEADRSSGERQQQVDVYLNFIGKFDAPMPNPIAKEIQSEERAKRRRKQCLEAQKRYLERKKLEAQGQKEIPVEVAIRIATKQKKQTS